MTRFVTRCLPVLSGVACAAVVALSAAPAAAQNLIKRPGAHPDYSVELEPHALLQVAFDPGWADDVGLGLGFRAAIPLMDNGPISKINNNLAIGFGFDWAHFSDCDWGWWGPGPGRRDRWWSGYDCSANAFGFPVYGQWNFFFTDIISVFGEVGLSVQYETISWDEDYCNVYGGDCDESDIDVVPVFQGGGRFLFGETVGLIVRVGVPYLSVGASILL